MPKVGLPYMHEMKKLLSRVFPGEQLSETECLSYLQCIAGSGPLEVFLVGWKGTVDGCLWQARTDHKVLRPQDISWIGGDTAEEALEKSLNATRELLQTALNQIPTL